MNKFLLFLLFISAKAFPLVTESIRKEYATKFNQAFVLQCEGKSGQAFFMFQEAFQQGLKAGESSAKLQVIADLFYWYRRYGEHLQLFSKRPIGDQVISDQYTGENCSRSNRRNYSPSLGDVIDKKSRYSEWGKDPQQARYIQDFMFAVGEIISGIFVITVTAPSVVGIGVGVELIVHGLYLFTTSLRDLWTKHQMEQFELQKISERAQQVAK